MELTINSGLLLTLAAALSISLFINICCLFKFAADRYPSIFYKED